MDPRYIFPEATRVIGLVFRIPRGVQRGIEEGTQFYQYPSMAYGGIQRNLRSRGALLARQADRRSRLRGGGLPQHRSAGSGLRHGRLARQHPLARRTDRGDGAGKG
ncbi:MAG: hypothetical protein L6W00_29545 [Lentisphaeria bacterium]|nr:MAG: hypothetical protein L6W00_29545 [Lentisphaeria bacterium]